MSRRLITSLCALLGAAFLGTSAMRAADPAPVAPAAAPAPVRPAVSFEAFRLISERNIFDPNRVGRTARNDEPPPRVDTITLVGTMHYEKGLFAFFDGSAAEFQKALHEGDSIAEYAVAHISNTGVELTRNGQKVPLVIGQQLRRNAGGDWTVVALDTVRSEIEAQRASAEASTTSATTPALPVVPPGASDTLKRLIEQRQKQLKP